MCDVTATSGCLQCFMYLSLTVLKWRSVGAPNMLAIFQQKNVPVVMDHTVCSEECLLLTPRWGDLCETNFPFYCVCAGCE